MTAVRIHPETAESIKSAVRLGLESLRAEPPQRLGDWARDHFKLAGESSHTKGDMDYSAGGMGQGIADDVRAWCAENGNNPQLRIVLCGHAGEHDALLAQGWHTRAWKAGSGYALTDEAIANRQSETLWCSPHCVPEVNVIADLFA